MTHPGGPLPSRPSLCAITGMTHSAQSRPESWSFQVALSCHNQCLHYSTFKATQQTTFNCWGLHTVSCHLRQRGLSYSHWGWRYNWVLPGASKVRQADGAFPPERGQAAPVPTLTDDTHETHGQTSVTWCIESMHYSGHSILFINRGS